MTIIGTHQFSIKRSTNNGRLQSTLDTVAVEEPLEIRLADPINKTVSVTMRTPGQDRDLAIGFLFTEGIIESYQYVELAEHCGPEVNGYRNIIKITLDPSCAVKLESLDRNFYTNSSCGVCGKTSIEALKTVNRYSNLIKKPKFSRQLLHSLPKEMHNRQKKFHSTGGIHASALFSTSGNLLLLCEDVGRHNALDKLIGNLCINNSLPAIDSILLLSGRISFELVQKASMAGIGCVAGMGAPSSLGIELAKELGIELIGFLNEERYNLYTE